MSQTPHFARCLEFVGRLNGMRHDLGAANVKALAADTPLAQLILLGRCLNYKMRVIRTNYRRLPGLPLPCIAAVANNRFIVIVKIANGQATVFDPETPDQPRLIPIKELGGGVDLTLVLLRPRDGREGSAHALSLRTVFGALRQHKSAIAQLLTAAVAVQMFALATPLFSQVIIDKVLLHKNLATLHVLGVGMLMLILVETITTFLQQRVAGYIATKADLILGTRIVWHLFKLPLRFFEIRRTGDLASHVRELESIRQFITGPGVATLLDLPFLVLFLGLMFAYSAPLTGIVLAGIPFFVALTLCVRPLIRRAVERRMMASSRMHSFLIETISSMHTVKSLGLETSRQRQWETNLTEHAAAGEDMSVLAAVAGSIVQGLQRMSTLAVLWYGAGLVMNGEMTVGQMIAFQLLSARVIQPVVRVVQLWQDYQQISTSLHKTGDILNAPSELDQVRGLTPKAVTGHLLLRDVHFHYPGAQNATLSDLRLELRPGEVVAVVGPSGSGKSTLVKLLQGLYLPTSGSIQLDGHDLRTLSPSWLRRHVGAILQESVLFEGTVFENIASAQPHAALEDVIHAARLAGAHQFITEFPDGYQHMVAERGASLSGGQRQRVAIARTLLQDPRVLVMDEATSALDNESERLLQRNLREIGRGRTLLIIAHRPSTIRMADRVVVLDKGAIVESGTHTQLLARRGLYYSLFGQSDDEQALPNYA